MGERMRKKLTQKERQKNWASARKKGMKHFVIKRGVLGFGPVFALLMLAIQWVTGQMSAIGLGAVLSMAAMNVVVGGMLWGMMIWYLSESNYKRQKN